MTRGMGKNLLALWIACLPGILSASCSSSLSSAPSAFRRPKLECVHGVCSERDICDCNPCWSGSTCQEYVDRFAPRFLAEEPFFILDAENFLEGLSSPPTPMTTSTSSTTERKVLFRVEAADDDLGLTCQLGQVGPAATCPCATPRYSVIGKSAKIFFADEETGDIFLRKGFALQPNTHYLITLQVSTLKVNSTGYRGWKERLTATLYIRSKNNEFNGLENGLPHLDPLENKTSDSSSSSESIEFSNSFPLPELSLGRMTAESIFRYKRQIKARRESGPLKLGRSEIQNVKISFSALEKPQTLQEVRSGENIKVEARLQLQLPVMNMNTQAKSASTSFQVQISTRVLDTNYGLLGLAICSANVSYVGSAISYSSNSTIQNSVLTSTGNLSFLNTAIWEWRELKVFVGEGEGMEEKISYDNQTRINFEVVVLPFFLQGRHQQNSEETFQFPLSNDVENLRIDAKIRFLGEDDEENGNEGEVEVEEEDEDVTPLLLKKERQITTFLQVPVSLRRVIGSNEDAMKKFSNKTTSNSVRLEMNGPFRIQRGEWKFYTIKVYIDKPTTELRLHLDQIGNQTKNVVSIQDIRLKDAGKSLLSCCPFEILRNSFQVNCSSTQMWSRGGDWCSISSPLINLCRVRTDADAELNSKSGSSSGSDESNVLEFQGIIYGLPDASPDSQFVLRVRAHVKSLNGRRPSKDDDTITATATFLARLEQERHVSSSQTPDSHSSTQNPTPAGLNHASNSQYSP